MLAGLIGGIHRYFLGGFTAIPCALATVIAGLAEGIALGVMPNIELEEREIRLREGDIVVLYTDGVTEAINNEEEQFGQQRLIQLIEEGRNLPAQGLIERIQQEVSVFSRGQPQFDDVTLMILKVA
jgi:sigma-B regulation protein RsbU (phosphoserine phosphatase)